MNVIQIVNVRSIVEITELLINHHYNYQHRQLRLTQPSLFFLDVSTFISKISVLPSLSSSGISSCTSSRPGRNNVSYNSVRGCRNDNSVAVESPL
mmetsp:Transcript_44665/g.67305  ORF Transcript_44665/g.67305 Transcript_44665/m.67305 type:complete len:95 (-) Transcript_44665:153-437(-)